LQYSEAGSGLQAKILRMNKLLHFATEHFSGGDRELKEKCGAGEKITYSSRPFHTVRSVPLGINRMYLSHNIVIRWEDGERGKASQGISGLS
jgi:hypothetical protein